MLARTSGFALKTFVVHQGGYAAGFHVDLVEKLSESIVGNEVAFSKTNRLSHHCNVAICVLDDVTTGRANQQPLNIVHRSSSENKMICFNSVRDDAQNLANVSVMTENQRATDSEFFSFLLVKC